MAGVNVNNPFQLDDPNTILQGQNAQITSDLAGQGRGTPLSQYGAGLGALFSRFVFGDPAVQKAQNIQNAANQANAGLTPQQDGESDIDYALRSAHATYKAVAPLDPNRATAMMDHIVTLQQAKQQQSLLSTEQSGAEQKNLLEGTTKGQFELISPDGLNSYGSLSRLGDDGKGNPDWDSQLQALKAQHPDGVLVPAEFAIGNRAQIATIKAQEAVKMELLRNQLKNDTGFDEGGLKQAALQSLGSNSFANRLSTNQKAAVDNYLGQQGINSLVDGARAQAEIAGVRSAMTQAGRRTGNIGVLENSLWSDDPSRAGMGNLVLTAMQGVDRTRYPIVNSAIASLNLSGVMKNGGPEAAYAGAVQSFLNEYARVMSGGGTMSTDSARREGAALLSKAQSPDMVRAAIQQLAQKETKALKDAGDFTLETLANKARYPTLNRISQKLDAPIGATGGQEYDQPPPTSPIDGPPMVVQPRSGGGQASGTLTDQIDAILGKH